MGEICLSKPDLLFERESLQDAPEFVLEAFSRPKSDPANIGLLDALVAFVLYKFVTRKSQQDFLDDIVFKELPADATHAQRAIAKKNTELRFIHFNWPRTEPNPNVKSGDPPANMTPQNSILGKMTPNGNQLWGETIFDFYYKQQTYGIPFLRSISTGSLLAKWEEANGETDVPSIMGIERAKDEKDPELIQPYDIQVLIHEREDAIRQHIIASQTEETQEDQGKGELQPDRSRLPEQWPPKSVFEPEAYPTGWPTEAFAYGSVYGLDATPVLRHYIPQHRLPEKLVVHDPSNVLNCKGYSKVSYPDASRKVIYELKPSEQYADRRKADKQEESKQEAHAKKTLELFLENPHSSLERPNGFEMIDLKEPGWSKPAVFVVFPTRPSVKRPDEAHVYLSSSHLIGRGNHSCVYDAEMVVPRSWLIHDVMCMDCVKEDVKKIIEEEDGPHGERRLKKWDEKTGMVVRDETRKCPVYTMKKWDDNEAVMYEMQAAIYKDRMTYEGPYRVVHTSIEYQSLERGPLCVHLSKGMAHPHPLTTKVRLAAKLTIEKDEYMHIREAENYQRFPKHFFQHWSGYNVWEPMNQPVPVGPLVPQFYGYYVPQENSGRYQSAILLMEQCGDQIAATHLSVDDKNECISLGLRMNAAGWYHGSFFERNILKQPGPLNKSPRTRQMNTWCRYGYGVGWSFRLIDFGRSKEAQEYLYAEKKQMKNLWSGTENWR